MLKLSRKTTSEKGRRILSRFQTVVYFTLKLGGGCICGSGGRKGFRNGYPTQSFGLEYLGTFRGCFNFAVMLVFSVYDTMGTIKITL